MDEAKKTKTSPFKSKDLLRKEIEDFANKYKTTVLNHAKRISDYFEMCCFNYIVRFYELSGYIVTVQNLQGDRYRYKCSTSGIQSNFSYFSVTINLKDEEYRFEIQHNLAVQSFHDEELFTTPDISIINANCVKESLDYYDSKRRFSYISNSDLISFCEVKQFNPFPELLFNFVGTINELKPLLLEEYEDSKETIDGLPFSLSYDKLHIAPSIMLSGKPNKQTAKIKNSLENRYRLNIMYDLFGTGTEIFSKRKLDEIKTIRF